MIVFLSGKIKEAYCNNGVFLRGRTYTQIVPCFSINARSTCKAYVGYTSPDFNQYIITLFRANLKIGNVVFVLFFCIKGAKMKNTHKSECN